MTALPEGNVSTAMVREPRWYQATAAALVVSFGVIVAWDVHRFNWLRGYDAWANSLYAAIVAGEHRLPTRAETTEWHTPPLWHFIVGELQKLTDGSVDRSSRRGSSWPDCAVFCLCWSCSRSRGSCGRVGGCSISWRLESWSFRLRWCAPRSCTTPKRWQRSSGHWVSSAPRERCGRRDGGSPGRSPARSSSGWESSQEHGFGRSPLLRSSFSALTLSCAPPAADGGASLCLPLSSEACPRHGSSMNSSPPSTIPARLFSTILRALARPSKRRTPPSSPPTTLIFIRPTFSKTPMARC